MSKTVEYAVPDRTPKRHRCELRVRHLTVSRVERIAPSMARLIFSGEDLHDVVSLGFDDHVKVFLPVDGAPPRLPVVGPNGLEMPEGQPWPPARDYTVRWADPQARELAIDFKLFGGGPASNWAARAQAGDEAWIAGPRGSFVIPTDFDWHLLVADETGLPAVARRLEELPAGARAVALLEVGGPGDQLALLTAAVADIQWVHRNGAVPGTAEGLLGALQALRFPPGDYHAWIACEAGVAKRLRACLIAERAANPKWMRAAGYWRRGDAGAHEALDG